ncbi:MAG: CotH kinase family protein, partial [Bacteroidaceae bacterium]|nr:CotH kinase family protein [Bacteroidaceae bacterium]
MRYVESVKKTLCALAFLCVFQVNAKDVKLTGTPMGSPNVDYSTGTSSETVNTWACAFDGNTNTYFASLDRSNTWVGLDLGTPHVITGVGWVSRAGQPNRVLLALFEGANNADFSDALPLYLIPEAGADGVRNYADVMVTRGFRYVRYVGPNNARCNIAEVEFYGHEGVGDDTHFYQITNLPTMSIHTYAGTDPQDKVTEMPSNMCLVYNGGKLIQEYPLLIRGRGNASWGFPKKPYRIKYNDGKSHRMLKDSPMESPAKAKKWTLINNYGDKTLIRNNVAFEVSRRMGMPFTPWCRCVDVILNGDYRGCYQLTDHVGLDKERINIVEMDNTCTDSLTITGGYLIEMNGYASQDPIHFTSRHGNPISVNDPDEDDIQPEQFNYISNYFNAMEDRVFASNYTDAQTGYRKMLDLNTFLRYFLACEYNGNTDMIWQVFMYKQRSDSLIYTGPVWDNDLALDNDFNVYPGNKHEEWTYKVRSAGNWSTFVSRILSDPNALAQLQAIWAQIRRDSLLTAQDMGDYVDSLRTIVNPSQRLNFLRWPYLTQQLHCNPRVWGTWDAEVDVVRDYVKGRVAWMDAKLNYGSLQQRDGVYQIATPLDLCTFSQIVAKGESDADAELLADLDMKEYVSLFSPLGTETAPYTGTFNGGGHTVDGLTLTGESSLGFFAHVAGNCIITDFFLGARSKVSGTDCVGALVGVVENGTLTMKNCGNQAMVEASGNSAASLIARISSGASANLTDCYNVGTIQASAHASSMVAWSEGDLTMQSCYNAGSVRGEEPVCEFAFTEGKSLLNDCYDSFSYQVSHIRKADVQSGALCFLLTEGRDDSPWRQNINNVRARDAFPVPIPSHGRVYKDGTIYTNINPQISKYRYYKYEVSETQGSNLIQFAEFDLLDQNLEELSNVQIYAGTESSISHENWENLTDGDLSTKYCSSFSGKASFFFDAGEAVEPFGYRIGTANDAASISSRNPLCWTLSGSNTYNTDNAHASWTLIDEQVGNNPLPSANKTLCDYMLLHAVTDLSMTYPEVNIPLGETALLSVEITPKSMSGIPLEWHSSDEQIATVDATGCVKAVSLGQCLITASAPAYCSEVAECKVNVVREMPGFQYFLLAIDDVQNGNSVQFSEFDLLLPD